MDNTLPLTLQNILANTVARFPDRPALSFVDGDPLTYAHLAEAVARLQGQLRNMEIKPGDKVAILGHNMPNWGVAFLAVTGMGAVAVPILPDFHETEITNILGHAGCVALFVSERLYQNVENLRAPGVREIVLLNAFKSIRIGCSADTMSDNATSLPEPSDPGTGGYQVKEDDLASIIYTSGTTGKSKGVMLTHRNIVFDAIAATKMQEVNENDVLMSILPLSHTFENTVGFVIPIMSGAAIYYLDRPPTASVLMPALSKVRPTFMLSVPMVIEKIFRMRIQPELTKSPLLKKLYSKRMTQKMLHRLAGKKLYRSFGGRLHFFGIGGAKLDGTVEQFLRDAKFPYAIGYGLTETSPILAGGGPGWVRYQSTGPALPGIELKINNPDPETGEGEVLARGDNVMLGYYKEPDLTREVLTVDGWFRTGDLGVMDKDGHLTIRGRLKNMIVGPSGENIYPEEIESVINNFDYVLESVVAEDEGKLIAMVHFNYEELEGEFSHLQEEAVQYLSDKVEGLRKDLRDYVNKRVNRFSQIFKVVAHENPFEKTATNKIKRFLYTKPEADIGMKPETKK